MQDFLPKKHILSKGEKKHRPYSYSYSYQVQILYHSPQVLFDLAIFILCLLLFLFPPQLSFLKCPGHFLPSRTPDPPSLCPGPCLIQKPQFQVSDVISPGKPALGQVPLCDPLGQCQIAFGSMVENFHLTVTACWSIPLVLLFLGSKICVYWDGFCQVCHCSPGS